MLKFFRDMIKLWVLGIFFVLGSIYGEQLLGSPAYKLHGPVNPHMAEEFSKWIIKLGEGETRHIHIETYGGHLTSGFKISHYLRKTKADIICYVDSHAMSAGALILQSCPKVDVTDTSTVLYHMPRIIDKGKVKIMPKSHPMSKMFIKEVDRMNILTDSEREAMIKGSDIYISGDVFMKRFNAR